jgi:hypothetical protein
VSFFDDIEEHVHAFDGPLETSRMAGTPYRSCTFIGCRVIELPDEDDDVIDWTGPAAEIYDQLIARWWERHPDAGEDRVTDAEEYADDMVARFLR